MLSARYYSASGDSGDAWELPEEIFDGVVNEPVLHQVIKAYLANQRQGNAATKTRGNVRGGGRKAWRQKGTGRARQGSIRAPHWRGGGVVFGPHPRSYRQDIPKKVKQLARRSAFNKRAIGEQISIIEKFDISTPKTRMMTDLLGKIGIADQKLLILTDGTKSSVYLSVRNLPNVQIMPFRNASAYDVLNAKQLLIEESALTMESANEEVAEHA